ncbi:hypothetical protein M4I32_03115 [Microbacterium sp. LRZ72]|nr:hypothetical protein [Microbacterium sp. LRZ72]MDX2375786.1 hypothetical protein [Microbacterium sp. LRZ72]
MSTTPDSTASATLRPVSDEQNLLKNDDAAGSCCGGACCSS